MKDSSRPRVCTSTTSRPPRRSRFLHNHKEHLDLAQQQQEADGIKVEVALWTIDLA